MSYWTLVVFLTVGGPSITIDGFSNPIDCRELGQMNVEYVQYGIKGVQYACARTDRPPVKCWPDTRRYGRSAECLLAPPKEA